MVNNHATYYQPPVLSITYNGPGCIEIKRLQGHTLELLSKESQLKYISLFLEGKTFEHFGAQFCQLMGTDIEKVSTKRLKSPEEISKCRIAICYAWCFLGKPWHYREVARLFHFTNHSRISTNIKLAKGYLNSKEYNTMITGTLNKLLGIPEPFTVDPLYCAPDKFAIARQKREREAKAQSDVTLSTNLKP